MAQKPLSRRDFLRLVGIGSTGALVSACGAPAATPSPTDVPAAAAPTAAAAAPTAAAAATAAPTTAAPAALSGRLQWYASLSPELEPVYKAMIDSFNADHPEVAVEGIYVPFANNEFNTKLNTLIASGQMPDVVWALGGQANTPIDVTTFAGKGLAADISALQAEIPTSDIYEGLLTPVTIDGKLTGIPFEFNNFLLWYNKDLFDAAGVAYPDESWTWQDILEQGEQLTVRDGNITTQYGYAFPSFDFEWMFYMWQAGGDVVNEAGDKVLFDTPEGREAFRFFEELYQTRKIAPIFGSGDETGFESLGTGKIAMEEHGNFRFNAYRKGMVEGQYRLGSTLLPQGPANRANIQRVNAWIVSQASQNPEAARALALHLGYGKGLDAWAATGRLTPYKRFTVDSYVEGAGIAGTPAEETFREMVDNAFKNTANGRQTRPFANPELQAPVLAQIVTDEKTTAWLIEEGQDMETTVTNLQQLGDQFLAGEYNPGA